MVRKGKREARKMERGRGTRRKKNNNKRFKSVRQFVVVVTK